MRGQAAARPVGRQVNGLRDEGLLSRVGRALVQLHGDVGAQLLLDGHVALGRPAHLRAVVDGAEREALVVELQRVGQAEHLEPARVGEHGAVVVHETMHAARFRNHIGTGAQRQVVGVGQHHLAAQVAQLARGDALHRGAGAHRHEQGRLERSVRRLVGQRAGVSARRLDLAVEQRHARPPPARTARPRARPPSRRRRRRLARGRRIRAAPRPKRRTPPWCRA